jgi:protein ImuA
MSNPAPPSAQSLRENLARLVMPNARLRAPQLFLQGASLQGASLEGASAQGISAGQFSLARARVHEFCGPARSQLAAFVLQSTSGAVIWASPSWLPERIYPYGLLPFADPNRIIFARCRRPEDILWTMEEALRSGAAPVVLGDLPQPPALTPIRRLHLAAEAGAEAAHRRGRPAPLGLILTIQGGAQGVDSRWHMQAAPSGMTMLENRAAWTLARLRARSAPPARWTITHAKGQISATLLAAPLGE